MFMAQAANKFRSLFLLIICVFFIRVKGAGAQIIIAPEDVLAKRTDLKDNPVVPIKKVASGQIIHRFHDTSPLSPSGKYLALFRIPFEDHYPKPGEAGEVVIVDIETGEEKTIARSFGWEMQLGANVQWGKNDRQLYFNDVDTSTWTQNVVQYDVKKDKVVRKINGMLFMSSMDGSKFVAHNLLNSVHAQSGYGVLLPEHLTQYNRGPVDSDGIFVTDVRTNKIKRIASIRDIYENSIPSIKIDNPQDHSYYCFKAMWNPQGTRIMTCLLWKDLIRGGKRKVAVITMKPDGSDIRTAITADQYAKGGHHMAWLPDGDHISINLEVDPDQEGLEIVTVKYDGTDLKKVFSPGSGHPSYHPGGLPYIITDSYFHETSVTDNDGFIPIRFLNTETGEETVIAKVFVPEVSESAFRVDAHPAWDRSGRYVIFNGYGDGTRCVYMADMKSLLQSQ